MPSARAPTCRSRADARTAGAARLEGRGPIASHADGRPPVPAGLRERLLRAAGVGELALGVVVDYEQAQVRLVVVPGEVQHRDVAVGVPGGEQRSAAGAAPD